MTHPVDQYLALAEQHLAQAKQALLDGNAPALHASSAALQSCAVECRQLLSSLPPQAWTGRLARLQALAQAMPPLQGGLLRCSAYVEQALKTVLPTPAQSTYVGKSVYGNALRQSGEFKVFAA